MTNCMKYDHDHKNCVEYGKSECNAYDNKKCEKYFSYAEHKKVMRGTPKDWKIQEAIK